MKIHLWHHTSILTARKLDTILNSSSDFQVDTDSVTNAYNNKDPDVRPHLNPASERVTPTVVSV